MAIDPNHTQEFLLKEYEAADKLTNNLDELRNKLMSFYITFAGVAFAGLAILFREDSPHTNLFFGSELIISFLLLIVALIGVPVIGGMARLRRVQIEYFGIISNIREYFLKQNYNLWNVVQVSRSTLPPPRHTSGTYMFVLLVIITSSLLLAASFYLFTTLVISAIAGVPESCAWVIIAGCCVGLLGAVGYGFLEDRFYFLWAKPPEHRDYSAENPPWKPRETTTPKNK